MQEYFFHYFNFPFREYFFVLRPPLISFLMVWNYFWMGKSLLWVKQICFPDTISNITNVQNWPLENWKANKFSKISIFIAICFNLPQVCIYILPCLFIISLITSFNILNDYFDVSLNLVAVSTVQILMNFGTQLL